MSSTTRRGRGWRLTKASWRLVRRDPTVVPLALLALGCFVIATMGVIGILDGLDEQGRGYGAKALLLGFAGGFVSTFILTFFCVALSHAISDSFEGRPLLMREAVAEARESSGAIGLWSLIAVAVFVGLQLLGATGGGGRIVYFALSLLWGFLAAYVIPIIALAGAGSGEALRESAALARRRWGEQLTGGLAIGLLTMLAAVVGTIVVSLGLQAIDREDTALGAAAIVIGILGLSFTAVLSFATAQAFVVALFRFDEEELSLDELGSPPTAPPIGRSAVFRVAGIIAGLMVMATLVGVLVPQDPGTSRHDLGAFTPENGWYYATFSPNVRPPLPAGSPVVYRERQVGVVIESRLEPTRIVVWFRASPELEDPIEDNPKRVGEIRGRHYLQVGPPGLGGSESGRLN